jgi:hypothetical protein
MDIANWLKERTVWQHKAPAQEDSPGMKEFRDSLTAQTTREVTSFAKGNFVSSKMMGSEARPASLRILGYYLTEHVLSHPNWRPSAAGESRLTDIISWGVGGKPGQQGQKPIVKLLSNQPYQHIGADSPSQFEWLLWQTKCVMLDAHDPKLDRESKLQGLNFLKLEVERVSSVWSQYKGQNKTQDKTAGDEVLPPMDRKSKNEAVGLLTNIYGVLGVPSVDWVLPEYNPEKYAPSVKANVQFDETYQKPDRIESAEPERDAFFDDEPEEEEEPVRDLTQTQRMLLDRCQAVFFLFEQGYQLVATLRNAKIEKGLRTVEPGVPVEVPASLAQKYSLPSELAYVRSVGGLKNPSTGKLEKSYVYARVQNGQMLQGVENELVLPDQAHRELRAATAPILKLPDHLGQPGGRYLGASRTGMPPNQTISYSYVAGNKKLSLSAKDHEAVMELNPGHVSLNVRGGVNHLFNDFFVDKVKPHYRDYLPQAREERMIIRDRVKGDLDDDLKKVWEEINTKGGNLEERTEIAKRHYRGWLKKYMPKELEARVPEALREMKVQNEEALSDLVSRKAGEKALVLYMEKVRGENSAPNYPKYGLSGRFKTWATQLKEEGGSKLLNEQMSKAQNWAIKEHGSLNALVPETHRLDRLQSHFQKEVREELEGALAKRGISMPGDLRELAQEVNPVSISIFYDRRIKHLGWGYQLDKPLPSLNLSRLAMEKNAKTRRSQAQVDVADGSPDLGL